MTPTQEMVTMDVRRDRVVSVRWAGVMAGQVALALALVGTAAAAGGPGNSGTAMLCRDGGWQQLMRTDGSTFVDTGACVSYGAKGGVVEPLDLPVEAVDDEARTGFGLPVDVAVLANDVDPDGGALEVVGLTQPSHGTATLGAGGVVTYDPETDHVGQDAFTYTVGDGRWSDEATVTVTVEGCFIDLVVPSTFQFEDNVQVLVFFDHSVPEELLGTATFIGETGSVSFPASSRSLVRATFLVPRWSVPVGAHDVRVDWADPTDGSIQMSCSRPDSIIVLNKPVE